MFELISKATDWSSRTEALDESWKSTKVVGKGEASGKNQFCISQDISLPELKVKAKSLGMTIGELFNAAAIVAYSKLDLPEERKPTQFNTL